MMIAEMRKGEENEEELQSEHNANARKTNL